MSANIRTSIVSPTPLLLLLLSVSMPGAQAFPGGAPLDQCDAMMPNHQGAVARPNNGAPYSIVAAKTSYYAGETIYVTVNGTAMFRGLILQARDSLNNRVGYFTLGAQGSLLKLLGCSGVQGTAVTHNSRADKNSIMVSWTAPMTSAGEVKFRATVVQTFSTFYMNLESAPLTYMMMPMNNDDNNMDNNNNNMNDTMNNMNDNNMNNNDGGDMNDMGNAGTVVARAMSIILSAFILGRVL